MSTENEAPLSGFSPPDNVDPELLRLELDEIRATSSKWYVNWQDPEKGPRTADLPILVYMARRDPTTTALYPRD